MSTLSSEKMLQAKTYTLCDNNANFYILDKNLQQASRLMELARQVGLNEEKLKKGFEQMFQTTPFRYLRDRAPKTVRFLIFLLDLFTRVNFLVT